jgi:hypothetical protein
LQVFVDAKAHGVFRPVRFRFDLLPFTVLAKTPLRFHKKLLLEKTLAHAWEVMGPYTNGRPHFRLVFSLKWDKTLPVSARAAFLNQQKTCRIGGQKWLKNCNEISRTNK